jgi:hypothetical protein
MSKKRIENTRKPRFYGQKKLLSYHPSAGGQFSHMAACKSSSKNTKKMNLIPVLNKTSPRAHTESELDMLDVLGKLVKYVVHWSNYLFIFSHKVPKLQSTSFWSQGI